MDAGSCLRAIEHPFQLDVAFSPHKNQTVVRAPGKGVCLIAICCLDDASGAPQKFAIDKKTCVLTLARRHGHTYVKNLWWCQISSMNHAAMIHFQPDAPHLVETEEALFAVTKDPVMLPNM